MSTFVNICHFGGTRYLHLRVIFTHTEGNVLHDLVIKIKIITNVSWEKRRVSRSIHEKWLCKVERYSGIWKDNYGIFLRYLSINLCFLYLYYTCYFYVIRYSVFYFYNLWNCHEVLDNGVSEVGWESTEKLCFFETCNINFVASYFQISLVILRILANWNTIVLSLMFNRAQSASMLPRVLICSVTETTFSITLFLLFEKYLVVYKYIDRWPSARR